MAVIGREWPLYVAVHSAPCQKRTAAGKVSLLCFNSSNIRVYSKRGKLTLGIVASCSNDPVVKGGNAADPVIVRDGKVRLWRGGCENVFNLNHLFLLKRRRVVRVMLGWLKGERVSHLGSVLGGNKVMQRGSQELAIDQEIKRLCSLYSRRKTMSKATVITAC